MEQANELQPAKNALSVKDVRKSYGAVKALDGVTFDIRAGSVVALLGPNGAGKTTMLQSILGVMDFEGTIEIDGLSVKRDGKAVRRKIGYVPQTSAFNEADTCTEVLSFLADLKGADRGRIPSLLELVNLPDQAKMRVGHLSGGMRQRLTLAAALLADPQLLLLDEPTASLDIDGRSDFFDLVQRLSDEGKTILLSTHLLDRLGELADRVIVLNRGRVAFDETLQEMTSRVHGKRFVVHLNGTGEEKFQEALRVVGIKPDNVWPAELSWDDLLPASSDATKDAGR
jgi:ABC-type multidrug transport system ATPase subunit